MLLGVEQFAHLPAIDQAGESVSCREKLDPIERIGQITLLLLQTRAQTAELPG